tara:strand:- start:465 stop:1898 length:1434 start_codon:yes stop_codon:yes gene_type:complete
MGSLLSKVGSLFRNHGALLLSFGVGLFIWFLPHPEGLDVRAWHVLAIFIATIVAIVTKPLPMGAVAICSIAVCMATGTLTAGEALSGFSKGSIWLIVIAFFIARGFIKTQLGTRIACFFVRAFGKSSLSLAYSFVFSEYLLAPAIPSSTARSGGIIFPVLNALSQSLKSKPNDPSARDLGSFLTLCSFQGDAIISGLFLTAMAGNPLIAEFSAELGVHLTWGLWALAALVPGIVCLIVVPWVIYLVHPPRIKRVPNASALAHEKLEEIGPMKRSEKILLGTFFILIGLWVFGDTVGISSVATAVIGLSILLLSGVLTWDDVLSEKGAWETLVWFSTLLMLAGFLNKFGVIECLGDYIRSQVSGLSWPLAFSLLSLLYYYSHYLFASSTAHIGAMYAAFLSLSIVLGTPPLFAALILAYFSSFFGGLTHYGSGPAPVLFGAGYVSVRDWWIVGGVVSVVSIAILVVIGGAWWRFLGYW